jgi:hypothetical protein
VIAECSISIDGYSSGPGGPPEDMWLYQHAMTEASAEMVVQLEVESYAAGQRRLAAAHEHGAQEQTAFLDQPVPECLGPDGRAADAQVRVGRLVELPYRLGLELPLDSRPRCRHLFERRGMPKEAHTAWLDPKWSGCA